MGFCIRINDGLFVDVKLAAERCQLLAAAEDSLLTGPEGFAVLKRHKVREHKRVYRCSLCNKVFQNSSNLNRHIRSHGLQMGWLVYAFLQVVSPLLHQRNAVCRYRRQAV